MRVLVVGKTGFIGHDAYIYLGYKGHDVRYTIRPDEGDGTVEDGALVLDLNEADKFAYDELNEGDVVVFLAAISSPDFCEKHYDEAYAINVTGTKKFISECGKRGARVLFFSSDVVYGMPEEGQTFDEESPLNPFGKYAEMKAEVENEFAQASWVKVFRLSYVFSKYDKYTSYLRSCYEKGEVADIFHPFSRSVVHLGDVLDGILKVVEGFDDIDPHTFNLSGPELVSRKRIAQEFAKYHPDFQMTVTTPGEDFFKARAKEVRTHSLYLKDLLGHEPTLIEDAMRTEFVRA